MPDLAAVRAVVTGASSGLGLHTALELARHGATVVLAVRDEARGARSAEQIRGQVPAARLDVRRLDLADLASVRSFAAPFRAGGERLDLLINNAGVMAIPKRETADGFEMQLGTNHLGHFALTGLLLPTLLTGGMLGGPPRIVTLASGIHRRGQLHRDDLMAQQWYSPFGAYAQSKLANLLFAFELARRAALADVDLISVGAHPGYAATNLQTQGARMEGSRVKAVVAELGNRIFAQSDAQGALPALYAATMPDVVGGEYFGPDGAGGSRGYPTRAQATKTARDPELAARLWEVSEELTGVTYKIER
jgi:NAD(P)-dependent dehydrogenase (short-subunit alcohol dehydrogenase family)